MLKPKICHIFKENFKRFTIPINNNVFLLKILSVGKYTELWANKKSGNLFLHLIISGY